jgi:hypothetical protein
VLSKRYSTHQPVLFFPAFSHSQLLYLITGMVPQPGSVNHPEQYSSYVNCFFDSITGSARYITYDSSFIMSNVFSKVDLPEFGLPTMATDTPFFITLPKANECNNFLL